MTPPKPRTPNMTHQRRIARELRRLTGCGYQDALNRVSDAQREGRLPAVLDQAGIAEAVRTLADTTQGPSVSAPKAVGVRPLPPNACGSALDDLQLFVSLYGERLRYAAGLGWLGGEGHRWTVLEDDQRPRQYAAEFARRVQEAVTPQEARRQGRDWTSATGQRTLLELASMEERIAVDPMDLDADPRVLCTPGGLLDLASGQHRSDATEAGFFTRSTRVSPDHRPTPRWNRFLSDSLGGGPQGEAVRDQLQILLGHCLIGDSGSRAVPVLTGNGWGKSTLRRVVTEVLGTYAIGAQRTFKPEAGLRDARLRGARLVFIDGMAKNAEVLLAQRDILYVRELGRPPFAFRAQYHVCCVSRDPDVRSAFLRPVHLPAVAFTNRVSRPIADLASVIVDEEGPGVLQWLAAGARRYLAEPGRTRHQLLMTPETDIDLPQEPLPAVSPQ
jgi:putative DNA primase/helicase